MNHPVCEICKDHSKFEMIIIPDLGDKVVCKDCFEEKKHLILQDIIKAQKRKKGIARKSNYPLSKPDENFLVDLTEKVKNNFEPVLFREKEMDRILQVLLRKKKNNPLLIGVPGVGKTAIVELLAHKIVNGKIPRLKGYKVQALNMSSFMSGTNLRGEFEQKFHLLIDSIDQKTILFIDEFHMIMGAGGSYNSDIDFSNLLKPYLTTGEIKVIGATTLDEYRRVEEDPAFTRRFQPVKIEPLDKKQTLVILEKIRPLYEEFHGVKVSDEALDTIVRLSDEYIRNRYFPDKAIDVLDEVCSFVSINNNTLPINEIDEMENEFNFFVNKLSYEYQNLLKTHMKNAKHPIQVLPKDIQKVVEMMTDIPISRLTESEKAKLLNLKTYLNKHLVGQTEAVDSLVRAVKRSRLKIRKRNKPTVLFFAGPTGVGKTHSARLIAEYLFGDQNHMIRMDMSEYMEPHSVSKLIGTPPGYVGYEQEGQLTEKVRRNPYCLVLLDEFEKAHPNISNLFLQMFEDGRLTDSKGRVVDFSNTIIIITSNIGVQEKNVGFNSQEDNEKTKDALKKLYSPEFINRLDEIITFNPLEKEDLLKIVNLQVKEYEQELSEQGIELKFNNKAKEHIIEKSLSRNSEARHIKRIITKEVEDLIVDYLIENEDAKTISIDELNGELVVVNYN